jgi:hypothetical protein
MAEMVTRSEKWERLILDQAASGMTVAKFCEVSSLSVPSFYYWKRRLQLGITPKQEQAKKSGGRFRQVSLTSPLLEKAMVRFPDGAELTFSCDPALMRAVVAQLIAGRDSAREI